jgi:uncharacterized glyoxalase superfamily protein PhnB
MSVGTVSAAPTGPADKAPRTTAIASVSGGGVGSSSGPRECTNRVTNETHPAGSTVIPAIRYADAPAAIDWLKKAFGFEEQFVVPGDEGTIAHAQLTHGRGMLMLGSARDDDWGRIVQPVSGSGAVNQSTYVVVDDADAHKAAGAEILRELEDTDYGSREYAARDLEGNVWSFGTYDPWAG